MYYILSYFTLISGRARKPILSNHRPSTDQAIFFYCLVHHFLMVCHYKNSKIWLSNMGAKIFRLTQHFCSCVKICSKPPLFCSKDWFVFNFVPESSITRTWQLLKGHSMYKVHSLKLSQVFFAPAKARNTVLAYRVPLDFPKEIEADILKWSCSLSHYDIKNW